MPTLLKTLLLVLSFVFLSGGTMRTNPIDSTTEIKKQVINVWICTSPKATKYHAKERCSRCSYEIKEVTKTYAKDLGYTACLKCYN